MSPENNKTCGCKGIRTCLLCEEQNEDFPESRKDGQAKCIYTYCPHCNLCWPDNRSASHGSDFPLYIGKLKLFLDFFNEDEETRAISAIDRIRWMPSQSGRRKQDFGPKVNFKKKKVKVGEFKGFPAFTETILQKFKNFSELSDFQPVELCHLEYSPERGSSIDPHVDDSWLWGERLVTINLGSLSVLTLVPFSRDTCECCQKQSYFFSKFYSREQIKESDLCHHNFSNTSVLESSLKSLSTEEGKARSKQVNDNFRSSELPTITAENKAGVSPSAQLQNCNHSAEKKIQRSPAENQLTQENDHICSASMSHIDSKISNQSNCFGILDSHFNEDERKIFHCHHTNCATSTVTGEKLQNTPNFIMSDKDTQKMANNLCNVFRTGDAASQVAVRIELPPKSLLVLAGCARYNWYHEIKRQDVVSRRLAMTFRELTPDFLDGGKESELGGELLSIASNFCDF